MAVIEIVVNFLIGYVREYYPLIVMLSVAHFGAPYLADWLIGIAEARDREDEKKRTEAP